MSPSIRSGRSLPFAATFAALAALGLAACGGGGGGDSVDGDGTLRVQLTDAPACGYDHVFVTVTGVSVHASASAGDNDAGWVEIPISPSKRVDLLTLRNGALYLLGQTPLAAGNYQQLRLKLAANGGGTPANSVVPSGGKETALETPSAAQTGLKIVRAFTVEPGTLADVVIDFDACKSVVAKGNGGFSLKPVLSALPMVVSGSVTGVLDANLAGARVYAQRGGVVVKATVADASGAFALSPLEQSSSVGAVDVVIVPEGRATGIVRAVPVVAERSTSLSTSAKPIMLPLSPWAAVSGEVLPVDGNSSVRAIQVSGGVGYEVAAVVANAGSGRYGMGLAMGAPWVGSYQSTLPIPLSQDAAAAGRYTLQASQLSGASLSKTINVTSGAVVADFQF